LHLADGATATHGWSLAKSKGIRHIDVV